MSDYQQNGGSRGYENGGYQERQSSGNGGGGGRSYGGGGGNGGGNGGFSRGGSYGNGGGGNRFGGQRNNQWRKGPPEPPHLYRPYIGSGNPDAPEAVLQKFAQIVKLLDQHEYTARSNGMEGPADVFGLSARKEQILPWKGWRDIDSKFTWTEDNALIIMKPFHPTYDSLKDSVKKIVATNIRMVLGDKLKSPALFVITYSSDGAEAAGQATARTGNVGPLIAAASALRLPVFNFGREDAEDRLMRYLNLNAIQPQQSQPGHSQPNTPSAPPAQNYQQEPQAPTQPQPGYGERQNDASGQRDYQESGYRNHQAEAPRYYGNEDAKPNHQQNSGQYSY